MIKLDDNLLVELGLGSLPKEEKAAFLKHMYETLELRVGTKLAERMSDAQMSEFEQFINGNDEQGAFRWLESNFPDYKDVVATEFDKLKSEIRPVADQIVASAATHNQGQQAPQTPEAPQPQSGPHGYASGGQPHSAAPQPQSPSHPYAPHNQPQYGNVEPAHQPPYREPSTASSPATSAQPAPAAYQPYHQPQPTSQPAHQPWQPPQHTASNGSSTPSQAHSQPEPAAQHHGGGHAHSNPQPHQGYAAPDYNVAPTPAPPQYPAPPVAPPVQPHYSPQPWQQPAASSHATDHSQPTPQYHPNQPLPQHDSPAFDNGADQSQQSHHNNTHDSQSPYDNRSTHGQNTPPTPPPYPHN